MSRITIITLCLLLSQRVSAVTSLNNEEKVASLLSRNGSLTHEYLNKLQKEITEYEVQSHVIMSGSTILTSHLKNTHENFVNNSSITPEMKRFNLILNSTLNSSIEITCIGPNKLIKANFISTNKLISDNYLNSNDCFEVDEEKSKSIAVLALNTIFVDADIYQPSQRIIFIAPTWKIIGKRTIDLSGVDADIIENSDDNCKLNFGKNGIPGLPGGSGGVFFGIGEKFINGQNLTIIANGGKGSDGEDGCPGVKGVDGIPAYFHKDNCNKYRQQNPSSDKSKVCEAIDEASDLTYRIFEKEFLQPAIKGGEGESGQRGGDGGKGGVGGKPGIIQLYEFEENSNIVKISNVGIAGKDGDGAEGGLGGKDGDDLKVLCIRNIIVSFEYVTRSVESVASKGDAGVLGANLRGIQNSTAVRAIFNPSDIVSEYKSYLRENLPTYFEPKFLLRFLKHLDDDENIRKLYDLLGLFDEHIRLEKQYHMINSKASYYFFYESLLERVKNFLLYIRNETKDKVELENYKKSFNYLYTQISSRMGHLKVNNNSMLLTNIENYLTMLKTDIDELKTYQSSKTKLHTVNKKRYEFKMKISKKIKDSKTLVEKFINVEIKKTSERLNELVQKLVEEIVTLIENNKSEGKLLEEKRSDLKNVLGLKAVFDVIDFASQSISYFGPYGAIAGGVIGIVCKGVKYHVLDEKSFDSSKLLQLTPQILESIKAGSDLPTSVIHEKLGKFYKLTTNVSKEVNENKNLYGDLTFNKTSSFKEKLDQVKSQKWDISKVRSLEEEFKQVLDGMKGDIKISDKNDQKKLSTSQKLDKFINAFEIASKFGNGLIELGEKYKANQAMLNKITNAIVENQKQFQDLEKYQKKIYTTLAPITKGLNDEIKEMQNNIKTAESTMALDVTKWQVQKHLRSVKEQIKKMTNGFKAADEIEDSIDNLMNTMSILIEVYKDIEEYQKDQDLVDFMADINTVPAISISTTDLEIGKSVSELELLIKSNVLIDQYATSVDAIKNYLFPFADLYLEKIVLPESLILNDNLDTRTHEVIRNVESMILSVRKYKNSTYSTNINYGEFDGNGETMKPFFTWKYQNSRQIISDLLSGYTVRLTSHINQSEIFDKDAVKFKTLTLDFKTKNKSIQSEVSDLLKAFKINIEHYGDSYYRFKNKMYAIPSKIYSISYSLETNTVGDPKSKNSQYERIMNGNYMLSPYGKWKITLTNLPNKSNITFKNLKIYGKEIDLELSGNASYIMNHVGRNLDLPSNTYYRTVESDAHIYNNSPDYNGNSKESLAVEIMNIYQGLTTRIYPKNVYSDTKNTSDGWFATKRPTFIDTDAEFYTENIDE